MPTVRIKDKRLYVGDTPIPLISGEVHYWRLAPARWREILERVRETGLRTVASYVCWEYHEIEPGRFDFTGETEPQRDLIGFLNLLQEMDFWILIRPGPYIYSEWKNAGVPDHAATYHRLSAEYQQKALPWMRAVTEALKPYFATDGGRIAAFQPDNEMDLFTHWFEDEMGLRGGDGLYQEFLRERYGEIGALNDAWGASFDDFAQVPSWAEPLPHDDRTRVASLDFYRFQHWAVAKAVKWHADRYREFGVDLPLYHNYYYGGDIQNWRELSRVVDFLGTDVYPGNEFVQGGYPGDLRLFLDGLRYQRSVSPIPYIAEFEAGVWHGLHAVSGVLSPNHYRLTASAALAAGIAGWNWYMLVNRDNWYYCPIQEWGRVRGELYSVFRDIVRVYDEMDPPSLVKLTDTAVTIDPLQIGPDNIIRANPILRALYDADIDYETFDAGTGATARPLLFYAGADWLSREDQEQLRGYVEDGGTLVLLGRWPRRDENMRPLNLLEVPEPRGCLTAIGKRVQVRLGPEAPVVEGPILEFPPPPDAQPLYAEQTLGEMQAVENSDLLAIRYQGLEFAVGYVRTLGEGRLVMLGLQPNPALVAALHGYLGIPIPSRAPGLTTALFQRGGELFLVAVNDGAEERVAPVRLGGPVAPSGPFRVTDLWTGEQRECAPDSFHIRVPRKSGGAWMLETG